MKTELLRPNPNHAPSIEDDDAESHDVEHCLRGEVIAALEKPETVDSDSLSNYPDDEEISKLESVVSYNGVLKSSDHSDGRI